MFAIDLNSGPAFLLTFLVVALCAAAIWAAK